MGTMRGTSDHLAFLASQYRWIAANHSHPWMPKSRMIDVGTERYPAITLALGDRGQLSYGHMVSDTWIIPGRHVLSAEVDKLGTVDRMD